MGAAAEPEERAWVEWCQGSGQRGREDHAAETQPVPPLREAGAQRPGAHTHEAPRTLAIWIQ